MLPRECPNHAQTQNAYCTRERRSAAQLLAFFIVLSRTLLLGEPGPGFSHFNQQRFVGPVGGLAGETQAFGCTLLVILEFGHGALRLRGNASLESFVPHNT
jgi:hypothetical protein